MLQNLLQADTQLPAMEGGQYLCVHTVFGDLYTAPLALGIYTQQTGQ